MIAFIPLLAEAIDPEEVEVLGSVVTSQPFGSHVNESFFRRSKSLDQPLQKKITPKS